MSTDLAKENPYVAVATKKHRNLKKKMEKIVKIEQLLAAGKPLDQEQLAVLQSKKSVEKALLDVAALKAQLEEVALAQLEEQKGKAPTQPTEEEGEQVGEKVDSKEEAVHDGEGDNAETANVETNTDYHAQFAASTMTEPETNAANEAKRRVELEEKVTKLVKALHVYQRYKEVTGKSLPDNADFFGRTLLGLTTISGFQDTLQHSSRVAGYYLNDDLAVQNEVVRGCNYQQMAHLIDTLADEMEKIPPNRTGAGSLTALLRNTISTPAAHPSEPTINAPPMPHIPPASDVPVKVVVEIPSSTSNNNALNNHHSTGNKFDLPAPQPVPQFVTLETPAPASSAFVTPLQFGAVAATPSPPPGAAGLTYATINFHQPEPFFQLTPPAVSAPAAAPAPAPSPSAAPQPARHDPVVAAPVAALSTVNKDIQPPAAPAVEAAPVAEQTNAVPAADSTDAADEGDQKADEGSGEGAVGPDGTGKPRRTRTRNRNRNNRGEGADNTATANNGEAKPEGGNANKAEGGEKGGKRRDRGGRSGGKKEGEEGGATAPAVEGGEDKKGLPKKKSFNRENNNAAAGEAKTEVKEYNWTKKFANKGKTEAPPAPAPATAPETVQKTETVAPVVAQKAEAPAAAPAPAPEPAPIAAPEPVAASKPAEAPTTEAPAAAAPVKRSSYLDAVRPGASTEAATKTSAPASSGDAKPQRKPYQQRDRSSGADKAEGGAEGNRPPRRDRSNNHVPREEGAKEGGSGRSPRNADERRENNGPPRKPFNRSNNNNNNSSNNNNNNNRTVNHSQTARPPAPSATKTETA